MQPQRSEPRIVLEGGKPAAVLLDIDEYERMLERLEEADDLEALRRMRRQPLKYRTLEEVLRERNAGT